MIFQREEKQNPSDAADPGSKPSAEAVGESSSLHSDTQTPNVPDAEVTVSDEERELAFANIKEAAEYYGVEVSESSWKDLGRKPSGSKSAGS